MERNRLNDLMQRYLARECSADEKKELALLISLVKDDELKLQLLDQWAHFNSESTLSENRSQQIFQDIVTSPVQKEVTVPKKIKQRLFNIRIVAAVAASVAILVSVGLFFKYPDHYAVARVVVTKASIIPPQKKASFIRNITLPDGSTVVLHAGSTIDYPAKFAGKTREVMLKGEAYFDVKHDSHHRFIIHTGKVTTTVLGTAFDIKAWPNDKITVSVTRGRVKVEDKSHLLAVLRANEQVTYNAKTSISTQNVMPADNTIQWVSSGLNFNGESLEVIAQKLCSRYGVNIIIDDIDLSAVQIVASYKGTEDIHQILNDLCLVSGKVAYTEENNEIKLSKKNTNP